MKLSSAIRICGRANSATVCLQREKKKKIVIVLLSITQTQGCTTFMPRAMGGEVAQSVVPTTPDEEVLPVFNPRCSRPLPTGHNTFSASKISIITKKKERERKKPKEENSRYSLKMRNTVEDIIREHSNVNLHFEKRGGGGGGGGLSWLLYEKCKKGGRGVVLHLCSITLVHFSWGKITASFKTIQIKGK